MLTRALLVISCCSLLMTYVPAQTAEQDSSLLTLPEAVGGATRASLIINNPEWFVNRLDALASATNTPSEDYFIELAQLLFFSSSIDGVDLQRPARFFWVGDDASLAAVIPLKKRETFLEHFGSVSVGDGTLVRIGERDGTVVYSQNTDDGLLEYRVLVRDHRAYVSRSAYGCRELAHMEWRDDQIEEKPPLILTIDDPHFLLNHALDGFFDNLSFDGQPVANLLLRYRLQEEWGTVVDNIQDFTLKVLPNIEETDNNAPDSFQVVCTMHGKAESLFAHWIARQQNLASRILSLLPEKDMVFQLHGSIMWQGEITNAGQRLLESIRDRLDSSSFPDGWDDDLLQFFQLSDRQDAFALRYYAQAQEGGAINTRRWSLREQPRAKDVAQLQQSLLAHIGLYADDDVLPANAQTNGLTPEQQELIAQWKISSYRNNVVAASSSLLAQAYSDTENSLNEDIQNIIQSSEKARQALPIGNSAVVSASLALHHWMDCLALARNIAHPPTPETVISCDLTTQNTDTLILTLDIPFTSALATIRGSGACTAISTDDTTWWRP